jgi:hypothetical protein
MKYIPQSADAARKWVEVCAQSLEVSTHEASSIFAQLCGVGTWKSLLEAMKLEVPSNTDSRVHPKILAKRREFYTKVLVDSFGFNRQISAYISQKFSPSADCCPRIVSIDLNRLHSEDQSNKCFSISTTSDSLETMAHNNPEIIKGDGVDVRTYEYKNVADKIRLSIKVSPAFWFNLLLSLGWKVLNTSYRKDYAFGSYSFVVESGVTGEHIPVYIAGMTRYPYDDTDSPANMAMQKVQKDFEAAGYKKAILFWYALTSKKIHGEDYTHPGMVFADGEWRETLINTSMHDVEDMVLCALSTPNINKPSKQYADKGGSLILGFQLMFSRVATMSELRLVGASSPTGWIALVTLKEDPAG